MSGPLTPGKRPVPPEAPAPSLRPGPWATAVSVLRSAGVAAGLVTAYYLLPLDWHGGDLTAVTLVGGLVAAGLFFGWEVWLIKRSPSPRLKAAEAVSATVSLYLVLFASGYYLLERAVPGSFDEHLDRTDALYFTFTTFTTVGFGDIFAVSRTGRVLVMCQMTCTLLIVGLAVRVLTAAVRAGLRRQGRGTPE
ncbi:metal transporter [Streptomyces capoamus]|uniref:Metal transporter n=1 Tax=Streptomyces capoamus TaxID=68183 RepID=A0A919BZC3_9ACTN|nr:two pore domain potassium channel family protein [Streptomyces capoamus]GGW11421.1 metal transporter [Streptomyces libani subsp. rufus]GHG32521.1 metal transporter [Streptomyces capoamus]